MLYLNNSDAACLPLARTPASPKGVSAQSGRCSACGIEAPVGMERHAGRLLCPFCHLTQHLYEAARLRAGKIIWLPKISQADLNRFVATYFMLKRAPVSHKEAVQATLNKMERIYKDGFDQDCALAYEQFLRPEEPAAANGSMRKRAMVFPFSLGDPLLLANSLDAARAAGKLDNTNPPAPEASGSMGEPRTEGLRLLFVPSATFVPLIDAWKGPFFARHPTENWLIEPRKDDDADNAS